MFPIEPSKVFFEGVDDKIRTDPLRGETEYYGKKVPRLNTNAHTLDLVQHLKVSGKNLLLSDHYLLNICSSTTNQASLVSIADAYLKMLLKLFHVQ